MAAAGDVLSEYHKASAGETIAKADRGLKMLNMGRRA
jgi:hypothetical protein